MYSKHKSFQFGQYVSNDKVLNKKIHENPKYKHVKPTVDSGKHVVKQINEHKEKQKSCNYKRDESFKRIKLSSFVKLLIVSGNDFLETENRDDTDYNERGDFHKTANETFIERKLPNVIMGIGELDIRREKQNPVQPQPKPVKKLPYLLLDVRDREEFLRCHIITAKNYPSALLSRSTGYESEDMKSYKNVAFKLIILYDDDEVIATRVAATLIERGYENIFLLSGGLKFVLEIFPQGLTTSSSPLHLPSIKRGASPCLPHIHSMEHFTADEIQALGSYMSAAFPTISLQPDFDAQSCSSSCSYRASSISDSKTNTSTNLPLLKQRSFSAGKESTSYANKTPRACESRSAMYCRNKQPVKKAPWK